jgi:hypothetical protein
MGFPSADSPPASLPMRDRAVRVGNATRLLGNHLAAPWDGVWGQDWIIYMYARSSERIRIYVCMYVCMCIYLCMRACRVGYVHIRATFRPTPHVTLHIPTRGHARKTLFICKHHGGRTNTTSVAEVGVGSVVFKEVVLGREGSGCMQEGLAVLIRSTYLHIYIF